MLLAHAAATWFMVGLIWFIQVVHYPLFSSVGDDRFDDYHRQHSRRLSLLLGVVAVVEVVTAAALLWALPDSRALVLVAGALLAMIWIITATVQVPQHARLRPGDHAGVARLVAGNWVRTALWTVRGLLVMWMLTL